MAAPQTQRSFPEVLQDIVINLQEMIRQELRLAKTELKEQSAQAAKPAATFGAGLAIAFYAFGFLLLAAVYGLSMVVAGWLAALIVGAALSLVAIALLSSSARKWKSVNIGPDKTIRSLEENVLWTRHQIK